MIAKNFETASLPYSRSPLVPVFGFGQNDVFDKQPKIDYLLRYKPGRSKWEKWSKVFWKGVMQVMFARFGVMPYPHPITVVGKFQMILKNVRTLHHVYESLFEVFR